MKKIEFEISDKDFKEVRKTLDFLKESLSNNEKKIWLWSLSLLEKRMQDLDKPKRKKKRKKRKYELSEEVKHAMFF